MIVPLTVALGRTGQSWEAILLAQVPGAVEARTLVDLLVAAEVRAPSVVVVPEDFPRLTEGLAQLRRLSRVVIVGESAWADCPGEDLTPGYLQRLVAPQPGARGQVVVVWGPQGSWGVTSIAVGLARSLAMRSRALLLDANVHGPGVGDEFRQPLGGLLQACLSVDRGQCELPVRSHGKLDVLSGVEPHMYPSVHAGALHEVLDTARRTYAWVVADTDSAVYTAGDLGLVPDWTTATAAAFGGADQMVIVVSESPVALQRLWRALPAVAQLSAGRATVVINQCRKPRETTALLAARLGDYLPDAAVGWVRDRITQKSLAPIVAEVARQVPAQSR